MWKYRKKVVVRWSVILQLRNWKCQTRDNTLKLIINFFLDFQGLPVSNSRHRLGDSADSEIIEPQFLFWFRFENNPDLTCFWLQITLIEGLPRRKFGWSITSSCTNEALCIISAIIATCRCDAKRSLEQHHFYWLITDRRHVLHSNVWISPSTLLQKRLTHLINTNSY